MWCAESYTKCLIVSCDLYGALTAVFTQKLYSSCCSPRGVCRKSNESEMFRRRKAPEGFLKYYWIGHFKVMRLTRKDL